MSLLLTVHDDERDTSIASEIYKQHLDSGGLECVWTGSRLKKLEVDHAIPWSLWRNNDLWNLLPAHPDANSEKSAKLPSRRRVIERKHAIGEKWDMLYEGKPDLFLAHARGFVGEHSHTEFSGELRDLLFDAFKDALEFTAVNRGVERW